MNGFSLMEIVLAVSVASIVFMASTSGIKMAVDSKKQSDFTRDRDIFTEMVRTTIFANKTKCMDYLANTKIDGAKAVTDKGDKISFDNLAAEIGLLTDLKTGTEVDNYHIYIHELRFQNAKDLGLDLKGNRLMQGQIVAVMGPNKNSKKVSAEIIAEPTLGIDAAGNVTDCKYNQESDAKNICDVAMGGSNCLSFYKAAGEPNCPPRDNFTNGLIAGASVGGAGTMDESSINCGFNFLAPTPPPCPMGQFMRSPANEWDGNALTFPCVAHGAIPPQVP